QTAAYCRARNFIFYTSADLSSWMIVSISIDRFLKVKSPIKSRKYCTRKLAIIISSILFIIFLAKNVHLSTPFIGDFSPDAADTCDPDKKYPSYIYFFHNVWPWIDLITFALIPFILISISNIFIIVDQYKRRLKLRKRNLDLSLITLLLTCSGTFIICNLPITVLGVIYQYISKSFDTKSNYDNTAF
ncbi:unnamed protein product, partial [Didymodactylos carnosus]